MYTYLLKNKQGNFETTTMRFATRKQATREAKTYASCWINLTGDYIVLQLKNFMCRRAKKIVNKQNHYYRMNSKR